MIPPCNRCITLGMCLNKLRDDEIPKKYKVYNGEEVKYPHFDISYTNVAMKLVKECNILAKYLEKKKPDWCISNEYSPDDMDKLCDYCEKKITEIRGRLNNGKEECI